MAARSASRTGQQTTVTGAEAREGGELAAAEGVLRGIEPVGRERCTQVAIGRPDAWVVGTWDTAAPSSVVE